MKFGQLGIFLFLTFFSILIFFYVFLAKVLNLVLIDQKNKHILYKKNSKVELHSSITFFWWPSSNFANFSCKMSDFGNRLGHTMFRNLKKKTKNFN